MKFLLYYPPPHALCQHNAAAKKQKVIVFIFIAFIDVFIEYFCIL